MTGNCADCWYRTRFTVRSYICPDVVDRCWHWQRLGDCELWRPLSEDEETRRIAYFNLSFKEWLAQQRMALIHTVKAEP